MKSDGSPGVQTFIARSFAGSIVAHIVLLVLLARSAAITYPEFGQEVVYSLTIEGGKTLGGKMQIPEDDKKSQMAPPKNVNEPQPKAAPEPVKETAKEKQEEKAETKPKEPEPEPDAEVSLAEKREIERKEKERELEKRKLEDEKKKVSEKKQKDAKEKEKKEKEKAEKEKVEKERLEKDKKRKEDESKKIAAEAELNKKLQTALQRYSGESSEGGGKGFGAAAVGGKGMGGGIVRPPEFFIYKRLLEKHIKSGWHWYDTSAPLICQIAFEIAPTGKISNVFIVKGSGNNEYDRSVLKAVKDADPVPAPPEKVYEFFASVRMTFDPRE